MSPFPRIIGHGSLEPGAPPEQPGPYRSRSIAANGFLHDPEPRPEWPPFSDAPTASRSAPPSPSRNIPSHRPMAAGLVSPQGSPPSRHGFVMPRPLSLPPGPLTPIKPARPSRAEASDSAAHAPPVDQVHTVVPLCRASEWRRAAAGLDLSFADLEMQEHAQRAGGGLSFLQPETRLRLFDRVWPQAPRPPYLERMPAKSEFEDLNRNPADLSAHVQAIANGLRERFHIDVATTRAAVDCRGVVLSQDRMVDNYLKEKPNADDSAAGIAYENQFSRQRGKPGDVFLSYRAPRWHNTTQEFSPREVECSYALILTNSGMGICSPFYQEWQHTHPQRLHPPANRAVVFKNNAHHENLWVTSLSGGSVLVAFGFYLCLLEPPRPEDSEVHQMQLQHLGWVGPADNLGWQSDRREDLEKAQRSDAAAAPRVFTLSRDNRLRLLVYSYGANTEHNASIQVFEPVHHVPAPA